MEYIFIKKVVDDYGDCYYKVITSTDGYGLAERLANQLCSLEVICLWVDGYSRTHFCNHFNVPFAEFDENLWIEF
jgi:hypothetical protein